jgi:hypothetical protein
MALRFSTSLIFDRMIRLGYRFRHHTYSYHITAMPSTHFIRDYHFCDRPYECSPHRNISPQLCWFRCQMRLDRRQAAIAKPTTIRMHWARHFSAADWVEQARFSPTIEPQAALFLILSFIMYYLRQSRNDSRILMPIFQSSHVADRERRLYPISLQYISFLSAVWYKYDFATYVNLHWLIHIAIE